MLNWNCWISILFNKLRRQKNVKVLDPKIWLEFNVGVGDQLTNSKSLQLLNSDQATDIKFSWSY